MISHPLRTAFMTPQFGQNQVSFELSRQNLTQFGVDWPVRVFCKLVDDAASTCIAVNTHANSDNDWANGASVLERDRCFIVSIDALWIDSAFHISQWLLGPLFELPLGPTAGVISNSIDASPGHPSATVCFSTVNTSYWNLFGRSNPRLRELSCSSSRK